MYKRQYNNDNQPNYKKIKLDTEALALTKKAYTLGSQKARRGSNPPDDLELRIKHNFNEKQVEACIKGYQDHLKSPEEQGIRRARSSGRICANSGRKLPPDEILSKRYTPDEIVAYKNAYFKNPKTSQKSHTSKPYMFKFKISQLAQNINDKTETNNAYHPPKTESPKETFIKNFIENHLNNLENPSNKEVIVIDDENDDDNAMNEANLDIFDIELFNYDVPSPHEFFNNTLNQFNHNFYFFDHFTDKYNQSDKASNTQSTSSTQNNEDEDKEFLEKMFNYFNPNP